MDIRDKVITALTDNLEVHYVRLEDDGGITGFVVSPQFQNITSLDRQNLIEKALSQSIETLTSREKRQILMIAGLTPEEYESVGARIRVHRVKELGGGMIEVLLHGNLSDAEYVRGALKNQKGVETFDPKQVPGAIGILMCFRAKGTEADPLTKAKAIRLLQRDRYIEVVADV